MEELVESLWAAIVEAVGVVSIPCHPPTGFPTYSQNYRTVSIGAPVNQQLRRPTYHVSIRKMRTGVSLVRSIQRRELYRVADEKHRLFFT